MGKIGANWESRDWGLMLDRIVWPDALVVPPSRAVGGPSRAVGVGFFVQKSALRDRKDERVIRGRLKRCDSGVVGNAKVSVGWMAF